MGIRRASKLCEKKKKRDPALEGATLRKETITKGKSKQVSSITSKNEKKKKLNHPAVPLCRFALADKSHGSSAKGT